MKIGADLPAVYESRIKVKHEMSNICIRNTS